MLYWHALQHPYVWTTDNQMGIELEKLDIVKRKLLCLMLVEEFSLKNRRSGLLRLGGAEIRITCPELGDVFDPKTNTMTEFRNKYFPELDCHQPYRLEPLSY